MPMAKAVVVTAVARPRNARWMVIVVIAGRTDKIKPEPSNARLFFLNGPGRSIERDQPNRPTPLRAAPLCFGVKLF